MLLPGKAAEGAAVAESAKALAETVEALAEQGHAAAVKQPESGLPQLTLDVAETRLLLPIRTKKKSS